MFKVQIGLGTYNDSEMNHFYLIFIKFLIHLHYKYSICT